MTGAGEAGTAAESRDAASPPRDEPGSLQCLHPRAVTLWRLEQGFRGLVFAAFALAGDLVMDAPGPTGLVALLLTAVTIAVVVVLPPRQFRAWRYALRERELYLRHGVFIRTTSVVPHVRIQHVDTRHGPIDRWLGLAAVVVYTAGTRGAMVAIPALDAVTADRLRDRLAALSGAGDAV